MPSQSPPLRSLARIFLEDADTGNPFELPQKELDRLRKVLRMQSGDEFAVLPGDGTLIRCTLQGKYAVPIQTVRPDTEPTLQVTLAQALPKSDRLDTVVRMTTEIGVASILLFPAERSVVKWEPAKLQSKLQRLKAIAREAAELSFRARLPQIEPRQSLHAILQEFPNAAVLSESEQPMPSLAQRLHDLREQIPGPVLVVGPEGGWSPKELQWIGERGVTLGPRVLRTDTAGPAALAALLFS